MFSTISRHFRRIWTNSVGLPSEEHREKTGTGQTDKSKKRKKEKEVPKRKKQKKNSEPSSSSSQSSSSRSSSSSSSSSDSDTESDEVSKRSKSKKKTEGKEKGEAVDKTVKRSIVVAEIKRAIEKVRGLSIQVPPTAGSTEAKLAFMVGASALEELADAAEAARHKKRSVYRMAIREVSEVSDAPICMVSFLQRLVGDSDRSLVSKSWSKAMAARRGGVKNRVGTWLPPSAQRSSPQTCYACGRPGHFARGCRVKVEKR